VTLIRFALVAIAIAILSLTYLVYQNLMFLNELAEDQLMIMELIIEWFELNGLEIPKDKAIEI
tara:strand:- start:2624 stop:2812 length:189 start_codon:yes stop_codon:yes gene_type:complete